MSEHVNAESCTGGLELPSDVHRCLLEHVNAVKCAPVFASRKACECLLTCAMMSVMGGIYGEIF